tara:strand:- start:1172 stop:1450 length:279 start_codon:yes stop_codon:yes gene_type:complete
VLFRAINPRRNRPTVFQLSGAADIDPRQLSVMKPFDAGFNGVYATLQTVGAATGMQVNRADDIWIHHQIIQDVVTQRLEAALVERIRTLIGS